MKPYFFIIIVVLVSTVVTIYFAYMALSKRRIVAIKNQEVKSKFVLKIGKYFHCEFTHDEININDDKK